MNVIRAGGMKTRICNSKISVRVNLKHEEENEVKNRKAQSKRLMEMFVIFPAINAQNIYTFFV